jgi:hypothetical protein
MSSEILLQGDVVMLCRHVFDAAQRGHGHFPVTEWPLYGRRSHPGAFERPNGTKGKYDFLMECDICGNRSEGLTFIEMLWIDGRLQCADSPAEVC